MDGCVRSARRTGAAFIKLGRAPTTWRTCMGTDEIVYGRAGQDSSMAVRRSNPKSGAHFLERGPVKAWAKSASGGDCYPACAVIRGRSWSGKAITSAERTRVRSSASARAVGKAPVRRLTSSWRSRLEYIRRMVNVPRRWFSELSKSRAIVQAEEVSGTLEKPGFCQRKVLGVRGEEGGSIETSGTSSPAIR